MATTAEMVSELGLRTEDASNVKFTSVLKVQALNNAQIRLAQLLHNTYLTELEDVDTDNDISSGSFALSELNSGNGVLRGAQGILKVSVDIGGAGSDLWATQIAIEDVKDNENTYLAGTDANPVYYIFDGTITYLVTTLALTTSSIYFLKYPPAMVSGGQGPSLNESLHPLIVDFAEAQLWSVDKEFDRRMAVTEAALKEVDILNARYTPAEGIGTRQRRSARP
jgi:hypothetical protein